MRSDLDWSDRGDASEIAGHPDCVAEADAALVGLRVARDELEQRRLARAVAAHHAHDRALGQLEAQVGEERAPLVALTHRAPQTLGAHLEVFVIKVAMEQAVAMEEAVGCRRRRLQRRRRRRSWC